MHILLKHFVEIAFFDPSNITCPPDNVLLIFVDTKKHRSPKSQSRLALNLFRNGCKYQRLGANYISAKDFTWNVKVGER